MLTFTSATPLVTTAFAAALLCISAASTLNSFPSCDALLSFYHTNAAKRASEFANVPYVPYTPGPDDFLDGTTPLPSPESLDGATPEPWVVTPQPWVVTPQPEPVPEASIAPALDSDSSAPGTDFSGTNVQVRGVDEPDIVKTDGARVFVVRGRRLTLVRTARAGAGGKVVAKLDLPTYVREMLIEGDVLVLLGSDYGALDPDAGATPGPDDFFTPYPEPEPSAQPAPEPSPLEDSVRSPAIVDGDGGGDITVAYRVAARGNRLVLLDALRMQGTYVSSREVDGVVRLVTSYRPFFRFDYPEPIARGEPAPPAADAEIRKTDIATWVPGYLARAACGARADCAPARTGLMVECVGVFRARAAFTGFSLVVVTTLQSNTSHAFEPRGGTAVLSDGRDVYSTATSLYVATTDYRNDFADSAANLNTSIHKFVLRDASATYAASGSVPGAVLNQFSMHEARGVAFVATTVGDPWATGPESRSRITALKTVNQTLRTVGVVGDLGVGERIFAIRYIGTQAYVVTFREVDPLYVVDIADPARMRVTGELKIPGFSTYLHPLGGGRLLGVGEGTTADGTTTGAKVSLFDVSDVAKPREVAAWTLKGSYSSAGWDHRAFLFWPPENVAVLPVQVYSAGAGGDFSGSIVLHIRGDQIVPKGRIAQRPCCGLLPYELAIERNFVLGRTKLWSFSQNALQVNDIRNLSFMSIVRFDKVW